MKNLLRELRLPIIILLAFPFVMPLVPITVAIIENQTQNLSFSLYLEAVGLLLAIILGFVLFAIIVISIAELGTKFLNNIRDKNAKKAIIKKFSLTTNSFKEIDVSFEDNGDTRNFFIGRIKSVVNNSNSDNCFNLNFHARIDDRTYDIPIKVEVLNVSTLIDILETLGCKHYLRLDENENFFWYIQTSDNEILYQEEITNYDFVLTYFTPKE